MTYSQSDVLPKISFLIRNQKLTHFEMFLTFLIENKLTASCEFVIELESGFKQYWMKATALQEKYAGLITLIFHGVEHSKNGFSNLNPLLAKGGYLYDLDSDNPAEILSLQSLLLSTQGDDDDFHACLNLLIDKLKHNENATLFPISFKPCYFQHKTKPILKPTVSVCIYNFNYGRYLDACLQSVFNQTYENIEVCFSDNCSTDDSWGVALKFAEKYPDRFNLIRNRRNYGAHSNLWNTMIGITGDYVLKLCSDDILKPNFIEKCISVMKCYPDAAYTMVHRDIIDSQNQLIHEAPFYDASCYIPGDEQAAVYMMSSINPSVSQIIYRTDVVINKRMAGVLNDRWFGDRLMDFHIACQHPVLYLRDALIINRLHENSDGSHLDNSLLQCLGEYVMVNQLADIAKNYPNQEKALGRLPKTIEKLGMLCLRYSVKMINNDNLYTARRYYHLSCALFPEVVDTDLYQKLSHFFGLKNKSLRRQILSEIVGAYPQTLSRQTSYPIPEKAKTI